MLRASKLALSMQFNIVPHLVRVVIRAIKKQEQKSSYDSVVKCSEKSYFIARSQVQSWPNAVIYCFDKGDYISPCYNGAFKIISNCYNGAHLTKFYSYGSQESLKRVDVLGVLIRCVAKCSS